MYFSRTSLLVVLIASVISGEDRIAYVISEGVPENGKVYSIKSDGSDSEFLFDFSKHPKDKTGIIKDLNSEGGKLYFSSNNNYVYGPARYNLFEILPGQYFFHQLTPGENSGVWGISGSEKVTGSVKDSAGNPYVGSPVFLEGKGMVYTDAIGEFEFTNVASGDYWLNAYRGGGSDVHESKYIHISNYATSGPWQLIPDTGDRWSYEKPVVYGDRVYYIHSYYSNISIKYVNKQASIPHTEVLKYDSPQCGGEFDAFDVGKKSGKMVVIKFEQGSSCGGVYMADKDGRDFHLVVDMTQWGALVDYPGTQRQIFWNNDESQFVMNAKIQDQNYNTYGYMYLFDSDGNYLADVYKPSSIMTVYGWSPDGEWVLYSLSPESDPSKKTLAKIKIVNDDFDISTNIILVKDASISGATWMDGLSSEQQMNPAIISYLLN